MAKWPDQLDFSIVKLLRQDGRMPNTEIAKKLGISEGSVRRRIRRMTTEGLIRVVSLVDYSMLGYTVEAVLTVQADPTKVTKVAKRLSELPEVQSVRIVAGEYDITASAIFKSNQELLGFLTTEVAALDGIIRTQTFLVLDVIRHGWDWVPAPIAKAPTSK